jgi:hypothetical protein
VSEAPVTSVADDRGSIDQMFEMSSHDDWDAALINSF